MHMKNTTVKKKVHKTQTPTNELAPAPNTKATAPVLALVNALAPVLALRSALVLAPAPAPTDYDKLSSLNSPIDYTSAGTPRIPRS